MNRNQTLERAQDAAWLIALWIAVHGGDPPPAAVSEPMRNAAALSAISALASNLGLTGGEAVARAMATVNGAQGAMAEERLRNIGIDVRVSRRPSGGKDPTVDALQEVFEVCYTLKGERKCVTIFHYLPDVTPDEAPHDN